MYFKSLHKTRSRPERIRFDEMFDLSRSSGFFFSVLDTPMQKPYEYSFFLYIFSRVGEKRRRVEQTHVVRVRAASCRRACCKPLASRPYVPALSIPSASSCSLPLLLGEQRRGGAGGETNKQTKNDHANSLLQCQQHGATRASVVGYSR